MTVNTQAIQQYVRIALYYLFGALGTYGVSVPDDRRAMIASVAGTLATLAWTVYGTRLNGLLEFAKQKAGVEEVQVKVNPVVITPSEITNNTSPGITAKAAI
jgi:hypothetical protein